MNQRSISEEETKLLHELNSEGFTFEYEWDYKPKELEGRTCVALKFNELALEAQTQFTTFLMNLALLSTSEPEVYDYLDYEDWTLWGCEPFGKSIVYYFPRFFRAHED